MKFTASSILLAASAQCVAGHYLFGRLIINDEWTEQFEYVRPVSAPPGYSAPIGLIEPLFDPASKDVLCGRNASKLQYPIKTAKIAAGDRVGFGVGRAAVYGDDHPAMFHSGFGSAWLSRVPEGVELDDYEGDGEWFKFLMVTKRTEQSIDFNDPKWSRFESEREATWGTYRLDSYNFTMPATTPAGKYLLRWEHVYAREGNGNTQYYVNCAHVDITNDGVQGKPAPTVKIPGHYVDGQPDVYFFSEKTDANSFVAPKPDVWEG